MNIAIPQSKPVKFWYLIAMSIDEEPAPLSSVTIQTRASDILDKHGYDRIFGANSSTPCASLEKDGYVERIGRTTRRPKVTNSQAKAHLWKITPAGKAKADELIDDWFLDP